MASIRCSTDPVSTNAAVPRVEQNNTYITLHIRPAPQSVCYNLFSHALQPGWLERLMCSSCATAFTPRTAVLGYQEHDKRHGCRFEPVSSSHQLCWPCCPALLMVFLGGRRTPWLGSLINPPVHGGTFLAATCTQVRVPKSSKNRRHLISRHQRSTW
jgi:hypothetical protein